jgi:hypothetical protein
VRHEAHSQLQTWPVTHGVSCRCISYAMQVSALKCWNMGFDVYQNNLLWELAW